MKYMSVSIAVLFITVWLWGMAINASKEQSSHYYIDGKVKGLQGNLVLNIEDYYLTLSPMDRFSFMTDAISPEELTMQLTVQPLNQHCELLQSAPDKDKIRLDIRCRSTKTSSVVSEIVGL